MDKPVELEIDHSLFEPAKPKVKKVVHRRKAVPCTAEARRKAKQKQRRKEINRRKNHNSAAPKMTRNVLKQIFHQLKAKLSEQQNKKTNPKS